jgi:hypothetical protein
VEHSPELDKVRQLLFPDLSVEEGWERIDAALDAAADPKRLDAIDEIAESDLSGDLATVVRRLREREEQTPPPPPAAA